MQLSYGNLLMVGEPKACLDVVFHQLTTYATVSGIKIITNTFHNFIKGEQ